MKEIPMLEKFAAQSLVEHDGELIFSKEKFAELIVRECADVSRRWTDDYVVEDTAPRQIDVMIKEHFGVEE